MMLKNTLVSLATSALTLLGHAATATADPSAGAARGALALRAGALAAAMSAAVWWPAWLYQRDSVRASAAAMAAFTPLTADEFHDFGLGTG